MNGNFDVAAYSPKSIQYTRKKTDLCSIDLDADVNGSLENYLRIASGEFKLDENDIKTKYSYFENHIITVYQKGNKVFEGTFEQLCGRIHEKSIADTLPNPVRYYADGKPYIVIGGAEISNHPVVEKLAEYDRLEKYILPDMQAKLVEFETKEKAVVHCGECINLCRDNWCSVWGTGLHKTEFCSFGRRKKEFRGNKNS